MGKSETIRGIIGRISRAESDSAAIHALLIWLDTMPPAVLIAAEGRQRAGLPGKVSRAMPTFNVPEDKDSTVEMQIASDARLARVYWEHPQLLHAGIPTGVADE